MVDPGLASQNDVRAALGYAPERITPSQHHRFATSSRKSDNVGWCQLFDGARAGAYGDFRSGKTLVWNVQRSAHLSQYEHDAISERLVIARTQRVAEIRVDGFITARRNAALWAECASATGGEVIDDAKGVITPLYRRGKKHFEAQYYKTIVEVTQ